MSTNYAVYHSEKGTSGSVQIGYHIDREEGREYSFRHSDPDRLEKNKHFKPNELCKLPLKDAINKRIEEGYKGERAVRKDAVKFLTHVFTGSHERMIEISKDKELFDKWIQKNYAFASREFGAENIVRFTLHMDERTPHIHCVTVPLTHDGRLSAKAKFGNRQRMRRRQDTYAAVMKEFGLERGVKTVGVKHESAREYYDRIDSDINTEDKIPSVKIPQPRVPTIEKPPLTNREEWAKSQNKAISDSFSQADMFCKYAGAYQSSSVIKIRDSYRA